MRLQKARQFWCQDAEGGRVRVCEYIELIERPKGSAHRAELRPGRRSLVTSEGEQVQPLVDGRFLTFVSGLLLQQV